jgi:predicted DCC family thiol-disulfide oxidoreductase YuxK
MPTPRLQAFFDGDCPLCRREIAFLRRRDRQGAIEFVDIADPGFDAPATGRDHDRLMAEMHVRLPDGTGATGVEAFRQIYRRVGFGWLVPLTRLPGLKQLLDAAYRVFARNRLRWTGRCDAACRVEEGAGAAPSTGRTP